MCRYGSAGVQVQVALENPRVTRANPYAHLHTSKHMLFPHDANAHPNLDNALVPPTQPHIHLHVGRNAQTWG